MYSTANLYFPLILKRTYFTEIPEPRQQAFFFFGIPILIHNSSPVGYKTPMHEINRIINLLLLDDVISRKNINVLYSNARVSNKAFTQFTEQVALKETKSLPNQYPRRRMDNVVIHLILKLPIARSRSSLKSLKLLFTQDYKLYMQIGILLENF